MTTKQLNTLDLFRHDLEAGIREVMADLLVRRQGQQDKAKLLGELEGTLTDAIIKNTRKRWKLVQRSMPQVTIS